MIVKNNRVCLSKDDLGNVKESENFIFYDEKKYFLKPLNKDYEVSKGGNSSVYVLHRENEDENKVIKISNYPKPTRNSIPKDRSGHGRFINEISALYEIKQDPYLSEYVVEIFFDGEIEISGQSFIYYVMEKGDTDLKEYLLESKNELDKQNKFKFCYDILMAVKKLHYHKFYHRDLKPDNIFLFIEQGEDTSIRWKVGDLGLYAERNKDFDRIGERIGPFGWISPEAMNKYLTEKYKLGFDCHIDDKSDVFQLGLVFWFIFNKNVPIGLIFQKDFLEDNTELFDLICIMLYHSKLNRFNLDEVEQVLKVLCHNVGI